MQQRWIHSSPLHSPIELEHRLTVLETTTDSHGERITDLESKAGPKMSPRDWMMAGAGVVMVLAALTEKTGWTTVVAALVKLYGPK